MVFLGNVWTSAFDSHRWWIRGYTASPRLETQIIKPGCLVSYIEGLIMIKCELPKVSEEDAIDVDEMM